MPRLLIAATLAGTIDLFLTPFARHFRGLGWKVDALASAVPPLHAAMRDEFDAVHEARWSRRPLDPANLVLATKDVQRCAASGRYDILHVHSPVASFVTRLALRNRPQQRPQLVYTAHGFHFHPGGALLSNAAFLGLERLAGQWTDHLVVINSDDLAAARRYRLVPPERLMFMPGIGVDTTRYAPQPSTSGEDEAIRRDIGVGPGRYLLVVGEVTAGKHPTDAVSALGRVASRFPDLHLVFAGQGSLEGDVRALARSNGVADRVHLLGFRRDVPALLRSATALLLSSDREGLPRCVLEAMASRIPCVATNIRGTRDLLAGGCGLLFEVGRVDQLADALTRLLSSPELGRQLAAAATERLKSYDLRHVIALHEQLYARALGHARRRGERAA